MTHLTDTLKLTPLETLSHSVTLAQNSQGHRFYRVDHPLASALFAQQGAHLISYIPSGQSDWLWVSRDSAYQSGKAIRGGVPICWPWFGKRDTPSHGFARISDWQLADVTDDAQSVVLTFALTDAEVSGATFPFRLVYQVSIGNVLNMVLTTYNTGDSAVAISGALHTYFAAERDKLTVRGLGKHYTDSTRDGLPCQEASFALAPETDRIYTQAEPTVLLDSGRHTLAITQAGADSVVVWNAGKALVDSMTDMHPGAEQDYLCIEAAITQVPVAVAPGQQASLSQRIALK